MKKVFILLMFSLSACQPQTESREHMDLSSDRMSDSILKLLDTGFAQPAKVLEGTGSPIASNAGGLTPIKQPK